MLGVFLTDLNLGVFTANLDPKRTISVTSEKTLIQFHTYEDIRLQDFVYGLIDADIHPRSRSLSNPVQSPEPFAAIANQPITVTRLFARLNAFLTSEMIVLADVGDALFAGSELFVHDKTRFLAPAYYASLGFAVPGGLGAQFAKPDLRPVILVGDGAFQMTGIELSTIARYGLNPIVIVLNNQGYGTERPMMDGQFNNLLNWRYSQIPQLLGMGRGFDVFTEGELETALLASQSHTNSFCILDIHLDSADMSPVLRRLVTALGEQV